MRRCGMVLGLVMAVLAALPAAELSPAGRPAPAPEDLAALRALARARIGTPDPATIVTPEDGPEFTTPEHAVLADLGRTLFFDPRLSKTQALSCATCHDPARGLGDGLALRPGATRHTPGIGNLAWNQVFFWDGRAGSLEEQALLPIQNTGEMALDLPTLVGRLDAVAGYRTAFARAFPAGGITPERIARALAAFERTLVSRHSPFDRFLAGDDAALGPEARRGLGLFLARANCIACHSGPNLSDESFHALGLAGSDPGRAAILPGALAQHAFKTPGLRNVATSAPYFHDGSAATLDAVLEVYRRGGPDPLLRPLPLSPQDATDLIAFLTALSDPIPVVRPELP